MAITYFALTSPDPANCPLDELAAGKTRGIIRLWSRSAAHTTGWRVLDGDTPSAKWVVIGDDLVIGDHVGFRSITTARKNEMIAGWNDLSVKHGVNLAQYGRSLGRSFRLDAAFAASLVSAI